MNVIITTGKVHCS